MTFSSRWLKKTSESDQDGSAKSARRGPNPTSGTFGTSTLDSFEEVQDGALILRQAQLRVNQAFINLGLSQKLTFSDRTLLAAINQELEKEMIEGGGSTSTEVIANWELKTMDILNARALSLRQTRRSERA